MQLRVINSASLRVGNSVFLTPLRFVYGLEEASLHAVLYALRHVLQVVGEEAVAQVVEQVQA